MATLESSFANSEWSVLLSAWAAVSDVMGPTARMAPRRQAYETQRTATVAAIDAVKADATVKGQAPPLDALLAQADGLASHDTMNFTAGNKALVDAETRAKAMLAAAPTVASYTTERAAADKELTALAGHAAAAPVAAQLAAIRKLLQDATPRSAWRRATPRPGPPRSPRRSGRAPISRKRRRSPTTSARRWRRRRRRPIRTTSPA